MWAAALTASILASAAPAMAQADQPMDHAAMAASYQEEAKAAEAKVASHQLMLSRYEHMGPMLPKGSGTTKEAMVKHCQKLVDSYKDAAAQANDLAKAHQAMAKEAQ
jgi:hypothetical protein